MIVLQIYILGKNLWRFVIKMELTLLNSYLWSTEAFDLSPLHLLGNNLRVQVGQAKGWESDTDQLKFLNLSSDLAA